MPRLFSTAVQGELNKRFGSEPLIIVEIQWNGTTPVAYCDRKLNGEEYPYPFLHEIGSFDTTTIVDGTGDSQQVSLTLSDIDGSLKSIISNQDIHLNPVSIYLGFQGLPYTEKALMFEGVINSPIVWDEGGRTLTFDVFSKLEDNEVGFTMEDGDFPFVPPADRNKAWPLVFGQVCNMEAVPVTSTRKGFLALGQGVVDPTLDERICQANHLLCPKIKTTQTTTDPVTGQTTTVEVVSDQEDQNCLTRRFNEICSLLNDKEQQEQYANSFLTVRGGESFPQGEPITIQIGDVRYGGIMNGETFTIQQTYHPDLDIENPECKPIKSASTGYRTLVATGSKPQSVADCEKGGSQLKKDIVDGSGASWDYYNDFQSGRFIWLPAGSEVFLAEESEIVNVVSLIPGVVDQVAAYRTYGDTTLLSEVDPSRYTVVTTDFGGYDVVEVRLNSALSLIADEDWRDEIYVSFTSDIGPNPVDTIEWLVNKYSNYTIDSASFAAVRSSLQNYPANFYIKQRQSLLQTIRDIAYQFRCAIFIRAGVVYIVYLSKEPTSLRTLTESDIVSNSFRFSHSETEDLQTSHLITWSESDAGVFDTDETDLEFVIKHNVPKYGTLSAEHNYYTQNTFDTILKSATFWMIRRANTWRYVEFETPITHLELDVFDCVTLNIAAFPNTKVVIMSTDYNVDSNTISFKAWTPILSGTSSPHYWAWPALQDPNAVFPLVEEQSTIGDGVNINVTPPEGHPLRGAYDPSASRIQTAGDPHPSDLDDVFPTLECKIATGAEIQDAVEPDITPFEPLAQKNHAEALDAKEEAVTPGGGQGGEGDGSEEREACGQPINGVGSCIYEVIVFYIRPDLVTSVRGQNSSCNDAGPCKRGGHLGRPCTGQQYSFCHTFGSAFAAQAFKNLKDQEARALWDSCSYTSNKIDVLQTGSITGIPSSGPAGECDPIGPDPPQPDGSTNQAGNDQLAQPGLASGNPATAPPIGEL